MNFAFFTFLFLFPVLAEHGEHTGIESERASKNAVVQFMVMLEPKNIFVCSAFNIITNIKSELEWAKRRSGNSTFIMSGNFVYYFRSCRAHTVWERTFLKSRTDGARASR